MGYFYILQSQKNGRYYIGSTRNLTRRMREHKSGRVRATTSIIPFKVVFIKEFLNYSEAHRAEIKVKGWKRRDFIDRIVKNQNLVIR